jgi:hypothetical protein
MARLEVVYRDGKTEGDHKRIVTVAVGTTVQAASPLWEASHVSQGCESQENRTLVLTKRQRDNVQIGPACSWADEAGRISPDGSYLVAWRPWDGAASDIHLIHLGATPADLGKVPRSRSADYVATWTRDGRLWFTSDQSRSASGRLYSVVPGTMRVSSLQIPGAALITSVREVR